MSKNSNLRHLGRATYLASKYMIKVIIIYTGESNIRFLDGYSPPFAAAMCLGQMAAFEIFELFLSEEQNGGILFECPSSLQETAMVGRSRRSRPTAGLCATQRGANELRRRSTNSSPMNEGEIFRCAEPRELGKRGKNLATGEPHLLHLSRCPAPARKWRRNGLKRLNPRPRMVWPRKPRTHNIWYAGAWQAMRSGEVISEPRLRLGGHSSRIRSAGRRMGNFLPRNPLESLKTGKESPGRLRPSGHRRRTRRARTRREKSCRKRRLTS